VATLSIGRERRRRRHRRATHRGRTPWKSTASVSRWLDRALARPGGGISLTQERTQVVSIPAGSARPPPRPAPERAAEPPRGVTRILGPPGGVTDDRPHRGSRGGERPLPPAPTPARSTPRPSRSSDRRPGSPPLSTPRIRSENSARECGPRMWPENVDRHLSPIGRTPFRVHSLTSWSSPRRGGPPATLRATDSSSRADLDPTPAPTPTVLDTDGEDRRAPAPGGSATSPLLPTATRPPV